MERRKFTREFKLEAVRLIRVHNESPLALLSLWMEEKGLRPRADVVDRSALDLSFIPEDFSTLEPRANAGLLVR
jgi:hypothetical protein